MDSYEISGIDNPEDAAWVAAQREVLVAYLARESVEHGGVSHDPRWFASPYVAVWAIRSQENPDRVGWWAISGDLPTDHMPSCYEYDAADVLMAFSKRWKAATERMARGEQMDDFFVGDPSQARKLAPLLATRAELLHDFGTRMKAGELTRES